MTKIRWKVRWKWITHSAAGCQLVRLLGFCCCYRGPANGPKVGKERILTKISRNPTCILVLSVGILMFYVALRCQVRPWWSWKKVCEVAQFPLLLQWWRQPPMPGTSPCNWPFAGSDPFASLKFPCYWGQPRLTLQGEVSKGCKGHWSEGWNFNGFWIPTWCTWLSLV